MAKFLSTFTSTAQKKVSKGTFYSDKMPLRNMGGWITTKNIGIPFGFQSIFLS